MTADPTHEPRLFTEFLDPVDMIGCFKADVALGLINDTLKRQGLRFPLVIDPRGSLSDHVEVAEYAPASARFGPYVDNVLGMNWELPSGRVLRIGERVVKSTTGYDLQRFLLHSDGRFGRAREFVLRLRPVAGARLAGRFDLGPEEVPGLLRELCRSSWTHWIDCIDFVVTDEGEETLQVEVDCLPGEEAAFIAFFEKLARKAGGRFIRGDVRPAGELPLLSIKCLPSEAMRVARDCVQKTGGVARALVLNGVVLLRPERAPTLGWLEALNRKLEAEGGCVMGNSLHIRELSAYEAEWLRVLEERWAEL